VVAAPPAPGTKAPQAQGGLVASVFFASGSDKLDAAALAVLHKAAATLGAGALPVAITGYADRTGDPAANVELAKARAKVVRDALAGAGVALERLRLAPPREVAGGVDLRAARRVDIAVAL
jgi:outer membrane protein OmpA-like peptidoglycan-associated protein